MLFTIASQIGQLFLFAAVLVSLWTAATVAVCAATRIKLGLQQKLYLGNMDARTTPPNPSPSGGS